MRRRRHAGDTLGGSSASGASLRVTMPMSAAELADLDRQHLWHPFTQQQGWARGGLPDHRARRRHARSTTPTGNAYIDGVSSLWCNVHGHRHPAHRRRRSRTSSTASRTRRCSASPTRRRSSWPSAWSTSRPTGLQPRLLLRQRLDGVRDRAEDGLPVATTSAASGGARASSACATATTATRSARSRSAASSSSTRSTARCCSTPGRPSPATPPHMRALLDEHGERVRGGDRRAARAGRGRHPRAPRRLPARGARAVRRVRRVPDLRRGRDRLRAHGHDVRLRAGGRDARPHVRRQGPHRRLPAARRDARPPSASTRASSARYEQFRTFFHGHTYTGNPLACAAALATLDVFEQERTLERLQPKIDAARRAARRARRAAAGGRARSAAAASWSASSSPGFPLEARIGHQVTLEARAPRRDHPPARRHGRADAAALDRSRPSCAGWSRSPPQRSPRRRSAQAASPRPPERAAAADGARQRRDAADGQRRARRRLPRLRADRLEARARRRRRR